MSGKPPKALLDMPKLLYNQSYYFDIFQTLSEWRGWSDMGGYAPISLSDVVNYCSLFNITSLETRGSIIFHLKKMDNVYLTNLAKRQAARKANPEPAPN